MNGAHGVHLPLPAPLLETRFVERPNRFLLRCAGAPGALPQTDGGGEAAPGVTFEAHLADPGRLRELLVPGRRVWLRHASRAPRRRTQWSAVLVESPDGTGLVSVDTLLPNRLVHAALLAGALEELAGWELERREAVLGGSRIDFVLRRRDGRRLALEVKSVTLVENDVALFPDAVTARGTRHVRELAQLAAGAGWDAAVMFVVQRADAARVLAAGSIDPAFAGALADARAAGVRVLGRRCRVTLERLTLGPAIPAS
jgi:sugar fermentation stimulation protein A